ncbi:MAG: SPASM domain-containing protein, partial [Oscillospiraceae bacterium]|nr:SPASM domain-containing protein [Oscillospiraceae bacterium]
MPSPSGRNTLSTCAASSAHSSYLVVEVDGSLYPCDFFILDQCYMGNLYTSLVEQALNSESGRRFQAKSHYQSKMIGFSPEKNRGRSLWERPLFFL